MTLIRQIEPAAATRIATARITGMAHHLPSRILESKSVDQRYGKPDGWLEKLCGVRSRSIAAEADTQESMAVAAARAAIRQAGIGTDDIDLLLFGAAVGRQPIPATAPLIKRELGLSHLSFPAYDVNATCLSALVALDLANLQIASGRARTILVVTSEIASRALPWDSDPKTAGLFGDGAAALVVSSDAPSVEETSGVSLHLRDFFMETYSEAYDCCALPSGGTRYDFHQDPGQFAENAYFRMDGPGLFGLTAAKLPDFLDTLLNRLGWSREDVDLIIPHQASPLALTHMARRSGFARDRIFNQVATTGNLVAASLPVALSSALSEGRIWPGMKILMIGTSAGVSLAGAGLES
ncbi:3-oxoacyl-ACP synthase III family protein [Maricaulis parjimensis]|uniref:3-oxoacyl-ACP synthase III family protein n=1 Tax=Maricaulis parjimensis TaxID=144023 RepID=UPI00193A44FF|nr:3-oxoacyl-[acyl-carrier-protein] synthase III C-terminal domain-containing protein [Maricaulis parjimensis]